MLTLWWTNIAMETHHFSWENPLFLWPFSIAMLVHQRVNWVETLHFAAALLGYLPCWQGNVTEWNVCCKKRRPKTWMKGVALISGWHFFVHRDLFKLVFYMVWSVATCSSRRSDTGLVLTAPQLLLDFFLFLSFTLILQPHRIGPGDFPGQPMLEHVKKWQVL